MTETIEKFDAVMNAMAALAKLKPPERPKPQLSIETQLKVDQMLWHVGEAVSNLLHDNGLQDFGAPMDADKAEQWANKLSSKLYSSLVDIRQALCWNAQPPFDEHYPYTPAEKDAIKRVYPDIRAGTVSATTGQTGCWRCRQTSLN